MNTQPNDLNQALGKLAGLYDDQSITEIMVDSPERVLVERRGEAELIQSEVRFDTQAELQATIQALLEVCGVTLNPGETVGDMRFPDHKARALAVFPPTAIDGPYLVIRKLIVGPITWEMIVGYGSIPGEGVELLRRAVLARRNFLVSGGTGSGKTTLANRIVELAPANERIVVAEAAHEMLINHPRAIFLEAGGPANLSVMDVMSAASKMRPDWLIIGELLGAEAMRAMEIFSRGHNGLTTIHANSVEDALARLEAMCLTANLGLGLMEIRGLIASAIQIISHQERMADGRRKIIQVTELLGVENGRYILQPLLRYNLDARSFEMTGAKPSWE